MTRAVLFAVCVNVLPVLVWWAALWLESALRYD